MAFQVSPGVRVNEIDQTNSVPAAATSIGAYAGTFNWGPIERVVRVSSEKELINSFGRPTLNTQNSNQVSFLTAASFLKYGNALNVVRAASTDALNATDDGGLLIKSRQAYEMGVTVPSGNAPTFAAKYAGAIGNSIKIAICQASAGNHAWTAWDSLYKQLFRAAPGTSDAADLVDAANDELHILVIDQNGEFSGVRGTVLEKFEGVSQASDARKSDGTSNYYVNVINETSKYVWWISHPAELSVAGSTLVDGTPVDFTSDSVAVAVEVQLADGDNGTPAAADIENALDLFIDPENIDISLIFAQADTDDDNTIAGKLIEVAEARKDTVAFVSAPTNKTVGNDDPVTALTGWYDGINSSSYAVFDSTALKVYDKYNDSYAWIPASGHIAGLCAKTEENSDAWFSPAGLTRGQLLGVTKLAFNANQADRDVLFKARINPIVSFPGQGILLFGDKTALAKASAFDAIGVRRLFIILEKSISNAAKAQLFEFNDEFTRAAFRNATEPFLRTVKSRRGITDFKVVCDTTNNTGDVVDRNEFVGDIYVKPNRSIRYIQLNFIATRTGVAFKTVTA